MLLHAFGYGCCCVGESRFHSSVASRITSLLFLPTPSFAGDVKPSLQCERPTTDDVMARMYLSTVCSSDRRRTLALQS